MDPNIILQAYSMGMQAAANSQPYQPSRPYNGDDRKFYSKP